MSQNAFAAVSRSAGGAYSVPQTPTTRTFVTPFAEVVQINGFEQKVKLSTT